MDNGSAAPSVHAGSETKGNASERLGLLSRVMHRKSARFSFISLLVIAVIGIIGPWIAPHDPAKSYYDAFLQGPSARHWLGTDVIGRDVASRILYGARITITVALMAVGITFTAGTLIGVISGYIGGLVDKILMRLTDILLALPAIVLAFSIVAVLGPSLNNAMIAIGIASFPGFARIVRGATLVVKSAGYVEASRSIGSPHWRIILFQIIPNISNVLIVYTTLFMGTAILETAALGFIGLGAQPPTPEWGTMLSEGKDYLDHAWWLVLFPGLAITFVVFSVMMLGDALRDMFDPKTEVK
ncbi:ABC transporter permease [Paenibacillus senegalensis]|uniref:ABC transporter permease n=1 Tax=Paenibacillus senegalensis TaxID=1465766 RepID=UPI000289433B